ncbi:MAG TPA: hypothetical protein VFE98_00415 [Candidatus Bathyarchaeia archaeon]|nr:hypothetical protein [Candidatus Bathyarchaeia archaeon]
MENTKSTIRLLVIFVLTLSMASVSGLTLGLAPAVHPVRADPAPPAPSDPTTQWSPAGPMVDKLLINTYADEFAEWTDLKANPPNLDLTDWALTPTDLPSPCPTPSTAILCDSRFYVTAPVANFGLFGLNFNHANTFFGINFASGSDTSPQATQAINFRQGVAHLVDRAAFISKVLGGFGSTMDNPLPPGQGVSHSGLPFDSTCLPQPGCTGAYSLGGFNLQGVCAWDTLNPTTCISAFHRTSDTSDANGIVNVGQPDFCDAADHWIAAGLATGKNADCTLIGFTQLASSITFFVRSDSSPRLRMGDSLAQRMCQLINGAAALTCSQVIVSHQNIQNTRPVVFDTSRQHLDWHLYTMGWLLSATPDQIWALYNSQFAGQWCGGPAGNVAPNYGYFCNPSFDKYNSMVEFNSTTNGAIAALQVAQEIYGKHVVSIDLFAQSEQFAYLKGWTGVNNAKGIGPSNFFGSINMWNANPAVSGNLRWGFKQGTDEVNPLTFSSVWDGYVVSSVYDTLVAANPYSPTDLFGWMVNQWQFLAPQPGDPAGTAADVKFNLRNDIFFHNGAQVTAQDYKFSVLAFKHTGGLVNPLTAGIIGVQIQNDFNFIVNLNSNSVFALQNIGGIPVLPQKLWALSTTGPCIIDTSPQCSLAADASSRDPIATFRYAGSGAFICQDLANPGPTGVGGKCTKSGTQASGTQLGAIVLQRNGLGLATDPSKKGTASTAYFRDSAKYKQWEWADVFSHGTVDILDVSNAAGCFNQPATGACAHWETPAATITCVSTAGTCNIGSLAGIGGTRASTVQLLSIAQAYGWFGVSWSSPLSYSQLVGVQALASQTLYEGGLQYAP